MQDHDEERTVAPAEAEHADGEGRAGRFAAVHGFDLSLFGEGGTCGLVGGGAFLASAEGGFDDGFLFDRAGFLGDVARSNALFADKVRDLSFEGLNVPANAREGLIEGGRRFGAGAKGEECESGYGSKA